MTGQPSPGRPVVTGTRVLLVSFTVLTLLATQLFIRADSTAQGFAWTIE